MTAFDTDILMIGHLAKDQLVVDGRSTHALGGAVQYGSIALRRLGIEVSVATRLHPDDFPLLDEMKAEGVQVWAAASSATSSITSRYDSADMERRICQLSSFAGPFTPQEIPDLKAHIYAVVPIIAGEVDLDLLQDLAQRGPLALDIQGFVRAPSGQDLVFQSWLDMARGLSCVTYLKADRAEAELLTGQTDLERAARRLAEYGPPEIVLTQSSGVTVFADGNIHCAPFSPRSLNGRTGRGDTCFSTYLGMRLSNPPREATRWAAAVTTLKQEKPGPWRGSPTEVQALLARNEL